MGVCSRRQSVDDESENDKYNAVGRGVDEPALSQFINETEGIHISHRRLWVECTHQKKWFPASILLAVAEPRIPNAIPSSLTGTLVDRHPC